MARRAVGLLLLLLALVACEREQPTDSPEATTREFIERMRRVHGDLEASQAAYALIWAEGQHALTERAERASAVAGRTILPAEMIAPSAFSLAFEPERYQARVEGDWSIVSIFGAGPDDKREVRCVREAGGWRVAIEFPPLSLIRKRADAGAD
jgi:hypothetical protein